MSENSTNFLLAGRARGITGSVTLAITAKAKKMKADGIPVISFGAGEPDFDTPDFIKNAAIQALNEGQTKYTPATGTEALRQSIANKLKRDNGLEYALDEIVVSCGAKHSLYNLIQVLVDKDDEVIIPAPYWLSYPEMVTLAGGKSIIIPTDETTNFKITPEKLRSHLSDRSKILILNSPSNPTGVGYTKEEFQALAEVVKEKNLLVISDEIYEKLVYDDFEHVSFASVDPGVKDLTIVVNGHSKAYSMTGWRLGYLACRKEIAKAVANLQSHSTSNPTAFAQAGGVVALDKGDDAVKKMLVSFQKRRDLILDEISKSKFLSVVKPQGAFYVFVNITKTGLTSLEFCERILQEKQVACVPGAAFGSDSHIRLSFATSEKNIIEGIKKICEFAEQVAA